MAFDEYSQHPPNIFSEVISKALADHLGFAIFLGTIKGQNQLYRTYQAGQDDPAWFTVWQDVDGSLETETDATTTLLRQAVEDDRKLITKGLMTQEEFEQEWYLSTDAAIKGAYYASLLTAARNDGRITRVPYDPALPVDTDWDLGISDKMSIWFSQSLRSGEVRLIDYYENSGEGIPHYAGVLKEKGYVYGEHWAPHDIRVRELGTGKSRLETAKNHGITFRIVRDIGVADGIDAARLILPRCWFDETKCRAGLEALAFYRKRYNERLQEFTDTPLHDWSSHGADAFRGLAVRHKPPQPTLAEEAPYHPPGRGSSGAGVGPMAAVMEIAMRESRQDIQDMQEERCSGHHRRHRIVHVVNDDPTPPWPEEESGRRCACGAEIELFTIVHQQLPDDRPASSVVH